MTKRYRITLFEKSKKQKPTYHDTLREARETITDKTDYYEIHEGNTLVEIKIDKIQE